MSLLFVNKIRLNSCVTFLSVAYNGITLNNVSLSIVVLNDITQWDFTLRIMTINRSVTLRIAMSNFTIRNSSMLLQV